MGAPDVGKARFPFMTLTPPPEIYTEQLISPKTYTDAPSLPSKTYTEQIIPNSNTTDKPEPPSQNWPEKNV